jgi:phosphopantothenoylcysteine synthetase/decarboxylase
VIEYETYYEYSSHLQHLLISDSYHSVVSSAAVSDYVVDGETNGKISGNSLVTITLKPVPKLLPMVKFLQPDTFLVGFKLLVGADEEEKSKAITKQFDSAHSDIVAFNDLKSSVKKYELYTSPQEFTTIQGDTLVEDFADIIMNAIMKGVAK